MADSTQIKTEKLLKYGKKQLTEKGVETQATTIREVLDDISNVKAEEPTQYGAYNIEVIEKDDGTQELHITDAVEKPFNFLQWKCDNIGRLDYEFQYCPAIQDLSSIIGNIDTSNVHTMDYMFKGCRALTLDVSHFNMTNVSSMRYMISDCSKLVKLDLSKWTLIDRGSSYRIYAEGFARDNSALQTIILPPNTDRIRGFQYMFTNDRNLVSIIGELDLINAYTDPSGIFANCTALETVTLKNIKRALTIGSGTSYGTLLDDLTVINTAKELWDLTGATSQKLTVSTPTDAKFDTIYVKLITATDEMIANDPNINSKKPCEVCASTDEGAMTLREYIVSKNWTIAK